VSAGHQALRPPSPHSRSLVGCVLVLLCALTAGCGRKGPIRPPEDVLPQTIKDLTATQTPQGIELSWRRPRTYADGSRMTDLGGFVIERATSAGPDASFARLGVVEVNDRERFRQTTHFHYLDHDTTVGTAYRYRVVSFTLDRYFSAPSNEVVVEGREASQDEHASFPRAPR
jgi:predicted small lipoprotein YifL